MKKLSPFLAVSFVLLLSACSSEGEMTSVDMLQQSFQNFSINVPGNWRRINPDNFANTIPTGTSAIFIAPAQADFYQNANIVEESLNTDASSLEYAKANMILGSKAIIDYRPVSTEEIEANGVKTVYHVFRARNVSTDPLRFYAQSYFARDRVGYTLTCIAQDENIEQQQDCERILKSFQFAS